MEMRTRLSWRTLLFLGSFALLSLTASVFGQKSADENLFLAADKEFTFFVEGSIYDSSRTAVYVTLADAGHIGEEVIYLESWMVTPFDSFVIEEDLSVELWMFAPFETEDQIEVELWMTDAWI